MKATTPVKRPSIFGLLADRIRNFGVLSPAQKRASLFRQRCARQAEIDNQEALARAAAHAKGVENRERAHRRACIQAYMAKGLLARRGKGHNSIKGIPAEIL